MKAARIYLVMAMRNLARNPRRTILNVAAISLGLFALIVFQALKQGLHREILESTVRLDTGSLQVVARGYSPALSMPRLLPRPNRLISLVERLGEGSKAAPRLRFPALASSGEATAPVLVTGVVPEKEREITVIAGRMVEGTYLSRGGAVLGEALAQALGIRTGSAVTLSLPSASGIPMTREFRVEGIYRTELESFDRTHLYLPIDVLRSAVGAGEALTSIVVLAPHGRERQVAAALEGRVKTAGAEVLTWDEIAPDVKQIMDINDATMEILMVIVFAIVALGIVNTMTTILFERFRELGVMVALGTPPAGIVALMELEALFLALGASLMGTAAALAACYYLSVHGLDLTRFTSANQHMALSHILRAKVEAWDVAKANLVSCFTALAAALYPSIKAARLKPVEALRHT